MTRTVEQSRGAFDDRNPVLPFALGLLASARQFRALLDAGAPGPTDAVVSPIPDAPEACLLGLIALAGALQAELGRAADSGERLDANAQPEPTHTRALLR